MAAESADQSQQSRRRQTEVLQSLAPERPSRLAPWRAVCERRVAGWSARRRHPFWRPPA